MYTFTYEDKTYELKQEACSAFINDGKKPLSGIGVEEVLKELVGSDLVSFHKEYYDQACEHCHKNRRDGGKSFHFLEFHFYLFSKGNSYVMSSLSPAYEYKTLPDLLEEGTVDSSYIASVILCPECGDYTIDLEYGLF